MSCVSTYEGAIVDISSARYDRKMPVPLLKSCIHALLLRLGHSEFKGNSLSAGKVSHCYLNNKWC